MNINSNRIIFIFKIIDQTNDALAIKFIEVAEFPIATAEQPVSAIFFPVKSNTEKCILGFAPLNSIISLPAFVKIDITTSDGKTMVIYDKVTDNENDVSFSIVNEIKTYKRKGVIVLNKLINNNYIASVNMVLPYFYNSEDEL